MRVVTVELLTSREESTKCFAGSAQVRCEWAKACVADSMCGLCRHSPCNKSALLSTSILYLQSPSNSLSPSLAAALALPFPVYAAACLELQALKLMGLRLPLGVSKTGNNRFMKQFSLTQ